MTTIARNEVNETVTKITQLGTNSYRVSQVYLGDTPMQLGMNHFNNIQDAQASYNFLTK